MTIGTLLDNIRNNHLESFVDELDSLDTQGQEFQTEIALRDAAGKLLLEGELGLPQRSDVLVDGEDDTVPESIQIPSNKLYSFQPITVDWTNALKVCFQPFRWESCMVQVEGLSAKSSLQPLKQWFLEWFDPQDKRRTDDGFQEAVHFLSDPIWDDSQLSFEVDLGSAPIEAFDGLLDTLAEMGARQVTMG